MKFIGRRLAKIGYIKVAIEERADLSAFGEKPSKRLIIGLILLALSYPLGWPAVAAVTAVAIYLEQPAIALIGGPAVYGFSWLPWLAGMWLAGPDALKYGNYFLKWLCRVTVERMMPQGFNSSSTEEINSASSSSKESE